MPPLPRVLCRGWISARKRPAACEQPVIQEGEPGGRREEGQCRRCSKRQLESWEREAARREEKTRRRLARLEPMDPDMTLPVDVFAGFREEEK